jgi:hypothetical protein
MYEWRRHSETRKHYPTTEHAEKNISCELIIPPTRATKRQITAVSNVGIGYLYAA